MSDLRQVPSPGTLPQYYRSLPAEALKKLKNFDREDEFAHFASLLTSETSKNFLLDFGPAQAWCGFDFDETHWQSLLKSRSTAGDARWIQIWKPDEQRVLIGHLTKEYGLSPRLSALILTTPHRSASPQTLDHSGHATLFQRMTKSPRLGTRTLSDEEKSSQTMKLSHDDSRPSDRSKYDKPVEELDHYDISEAIWHLQSVDYGMKYLCLGYNAFYNVRPNVDEASEGGLFSADLPHAHRVWHWIVLCDDNMVVSITGGASTFEPATTTFLRQHLLSVFRQLSIAHKHPVEKSVSLVPIRRMLQKEQNPEGAAGLLLYYLFDDWTSTYGLVARRQNLYTTRLNETRRKMMQKADLKNVELLHRLGRQMAVLRRVYMSYHLMINKVLERHKGNRAVVATNNGSQNGTYLSPAALDRFERLADRITLYVLAEIEESISLKDQLLDMNFNLITIKQSDSVERLTRITILLAKVTILVLPVTLMTSYFSVQIPDTGFTLKKYWISFATILAFSFVGLLIFGWVSKTVEGGLVYQSFAKALWFLPKRKSGSDATGKTRKE